MQAADLWDCLFLTLPEIEQLLGHVQLHAQHGFLLPMFTLAAHTGARRSEMIRSQLDDLDFDQRIVTIREKKRVRGKSSTRRVPISPHLSNVLQCWVADHPGGRYTFCLDGEIPRSRRKAEGPQHLTRNQARYHLVHTLVRSKWQKIRGWHVFRHSFCSNCAARGIDQRIINAWTGHQTEDMVRRYRHLIPNQQQEAIQQVFG